MQENYSFFKPPKLVRDTSRVFDEGHNLEETPSRVRFSLINQADSKNDSAGSVVNVATSAVDNNSRDLDTEIKEIIGGNFNPYQFGFNNSSNAKDMSIEDVSTEDISMKDVPIEGGFLSLHDDEKKARIIAEEAEHTGKAEEAEIETRAETAVEARTGADAETRMMTETITKVRTEPSEVAEAMVAGTEMGTGTGTWTRTERETASEEKVGSVAMAGANLNDASLAGSSKVFEWLNNIAEELERCRLRNC